MADRKTDRENGNQKNGGKNDGRRGLKRRHILGGGAALLVAGGAIGAYKHRGPPIRRDRLATSEGAIYERGLVPVEKSGWTMPEGVTTPYPTLGESLDTDALVVGAGLAGASLALHLAEAGVPTVVLEARQPGWGASGRNAGHVLPMLKDLDLFQSFPDEGRAFLEAFRTQFTIPFDLAEKYGIDCDAVQGGYVNALQTEKAFEKFHVEHAYLEKEGYQKVIRLTGSEMEAATGSRRYPYGVVFEKGGRVNPYLLTNGMIENAVRLGARVFGNSEALSITPDGKGWRVRTAEGDVRAKRVIFCTAAYPNDIVPAFATNFHPLVAFALTTKPLPEEAQKIIMPGGGAFAEAPVDLHPMVKDRHGRLILSSLPTTFNAADAEHHFRDQLAWVHRTWPETRDIDIQMETYWTGRVAMRKREFPGAYRLKPGLYGLMHFNAWGNVMAPLMGKLFAEGLTADQPDRMPFPLEQPESVFFQAGQDLAMRDILLPAARLASRMGII